MRVPGHHEPGPHREEPPTLDEPLEAGAERLQHRLPGTHDENHPLTEELTPSPPQPATPGGCLSFQVERLTPGTEQAQRPCSSSYEGAPDVKGAGRVFGRLGCAPRRRWGVRGRVENGLSCVLSW